MIIIERIDNYFTRQGFAFVLFCFFLVSGMELKTLHLQYLQGRQGTTELNPQPKALFLMQKLEKQTNKQQQKT